MNKEVLIIDDDESIAWVVQKALEPVGYKVVSHTKMSSGLKAVKDSSQVILLDFILPDGNGLDGLREIKSSDPEATVIMITAHGKMESTIDAMKEGAYDYIEKPFDIEELKIVVEKAFKDMALKEELRKFKEAEGEAPQIVGRSEKMLKVFKETGRVASKDVTVLITGESGTGKELVAKAIHFNGKRSSGPFVAINCASIPKDLLEAELFGWEKGAFTGAKEKRIGKIESANGGTLFLDEISELALNLQAKLLRFMQDNEFTPLGTNKAAKANARIIGATNKNLKEAVAKGTFREDLYYRFNVVQIKMPPLRDRREDILPLAKHFLKEAREKFETGQKELTKEAKDFITKYDWPGNVRELENAIKSACILSDGVSIEKRDLHVEEGNTYSIKEFLEDKLRKYLKDMTKLETANLHAAVMSEVEKALISIVLKETKGNQLKTAKTLGINRNTLRSKIKEYKIK
ncbi:MAG: sigma-54-dependent Fis family transcriptional regulator [Nitrospirae bacterium]|nr:MAG: sigma-54-dependent Fis family transcriptional regulator [Nitrospirota bacterium]